MSDKFGRNYRLTIYPPDGGDAIIVTMPFTIHFTLIRDTGSQVNRLDIQVYNLSEANRKRIFQDRYVLGDCVNSDGNPFLDKEGNPIGNHNIILEIGYGTLYRVFYGRIFQAGSSREGTNIVTSIEARDGNSDVSSSQIFQTIQAPVTLGDILKTLVGQFPSLQLGAIGNFSDTFNRPVVLNGNTWNLLKQYSNGQVFIDNGKIYVLRDSEVLDGIALINDASGLLETPHREEGFLTITTLMESGINVGQQIDFESTIQPEYNGRYKVLGVIHHGTISGGVCGNMRSIFQLNAPNQFAHGKQKAFTVVPSA